MHTLSDAVGSLEIVDDVTPSDRMERFFAENPNLQTPYLLMDLDVVRNRYLRLRKALSGADIYYAVKANPDPAVIRTLAALGSRFDVASIGEIDRCLDLGIAPSALSFGNTIKRERDIADAVERQVSFFAVDCDEELAKILRHTSHGSVLVRLGTEPTSAEWPLNDKFGCVPAQAEQLLLRAAEHGVAVGVSFHVGSQQRDLTAWEAPLATVASLAESLAQRGYQLSSVNLGGGIPGNHLRRTSPIEDYGRAIQQAMKRHLDGLDVRYMVEPGRYLVSDAGIIRSEVLLITQKLIDQGRRWVYLDVGRYNGLAETEDEAIRYRIRCLRATGALVDSVLAGPTCDSTDVIYENEPYPLPNDLVIGDYVDVLSAGAYTVSYSSVWFNGFEPIRTYHLPASLPVELP